MLSINHDLPKIPVDKINNSFCDNLFLARLDLLPLPATGNKWFKLKYNLEEAKKQKFDLVVTFGGAYSNHLYATAEAASHFGFKSVGIVRGEECFPLNDTLSYCVSKGMQLFYMSREDYRQKNNPDFLKAWMEEKNISKGFVIPEGGSNTNAVDGVAELVDLLPENTDIIATPCGTGATLAGLVKGLKPNQEAWGFAALKGADFLMDDIKQLLSKTDSLAGANKKWRFFSEYHLGGYAKLPEEPFIFIQQFHKEHDILLDPIYNGKMMYGLLDLAKKGALPEDKKIVALHTGGQQSWDGLKEKKRIFLSE